MANPSFWNKKLFFFKPVLLTTLVLGALYCLIYYSIFIIGENNWFKEQLWYFWFPGTLPIIPMAFIAWKYSKAYTFSNSRFGAIDIFFVSTAFAGLFTGLSANLIHNLSVTQQTIHSPSEVFTSDADYLQLNETKVIPMYFRHTSYSTSFKRYGPDDIIVKVYLAAPIATRNDTSFFYFKSYRNNIGNASNNQVEEETGLLQNSAEADFKAITELNKQWTYRNRNTWAQEDLVKLIHKNDPFKNHTVIMLEDVKTPKAFSSSSLIWPIIPLIGQFLFFLVVFSKKTEFHTKIADKINENPFHIGKKELQNYQKSLSNGKITIGYASLCLIVFLAMILLGADPMHIGNDYTNLWSLGRKTTEKGQYWQFFTYAFVHANLIHIFMNTLVVLLLGVMLESILKWRLMLLLLLVGMVGSGMVSYYMNYDIGNASVGASGAGMALGGAVLGLYLHKELRSELDAILIVSLIFTVPTLLFGFSILVDNWAHIGGVMVGIVFGAVAGIWLKSKPLNG